MQVKLTSGDYDILDHGNVFLFDEESDLTLDLRFDSSFEVKLTIQFMTSSDGEQSIETKNEGNHIFMRCINFMDYGTGLNTPAQIAVFQEKRIYFIFWSYRLGRGNGEKKARKVEYTIFGERQESGR